jgi:hypothetical protein
MVTFPPFLAACLPHYTSGQTYFYPAFNAVNSEDAIKFAHEFGEVIAMPIMLEAVMRVRATKGTFVFLHSSSFAPEPPLDEASPASCPFLPL